MATNIYKQENLEHFQKIIKIFRSIVNVLLTFKIDIAFSMKNEQLARRKTTRTVKRSVVEISMRRKAQALCAQ